MWGPKVAIVRRTGIRLAPAWRTRALNEYGLNLITSPCERYQHCWMNGGPGRQCVRREGIVRAAVDVADGRRPRAPGDAAGDVPDVMSKA